MPYSSGTFSRVHDFTSDRDAGIKIQASRTDAEFDGIATALSTAILKDGTQTTTAVVPFAFGISIVDNKAITLGTNSDITIQYDETTNDSLEIAAAVEGAALGIVLKSDQGDDNADQHKLSIADGGTLTLGSKISGSFVSYLTHTPNATVASSTTAIGGNLTVGGDLTVTGDDITMGTNTAGHLLIADGTNFNSVGVGSLSEISTVANDDVFLAVDTSGGGLKKITRSTIVAGLAVAGSGISNVVEDTTPQLGGDLDVNGNGLVSTSNGNIVLTPNGSGVVRIDGTNGIDMESGAISIKNSGAESYVRFYCESSNQHYTQLQAAPHSAYTGNVTVVLPASADTLVGKATTDTLTNKTLTSPKINEDVAVTATATELNLLDGVTSTTAELNILDGVTASAADINLIDGITNGTVAASKAIVTDSDKDISGGRNITISGELDAATLDISGNIDVDGTANLDVVDIDGAVDMASTLTVSGTTKLGEIASIGQSSPLSPNDATSFLHIGDSNNQDTSIILEDGVEIWEIYQNDTLSFRRDTTIVQELNRDGYVTQPLQVYVQAKGSSTRHTQTSANTDTALDFSEVTDNTNSFNESGGIFTAPVAGRYFIHYYTSQKSNTSYIGLTVKHNGTLVARDYNELPNISADWVSQQVTIILNMAASDTVRPYMNTGGTNGQSLESEYRGCSIYLLG